MGGTIYGSFSGISSSNIIPYIVWSSVENINSNYSDITAILYFHRSNTAYTGFNNTGSANANSNINGNTNNSSIVFDLRGGTIDDNVKSITQRVYHNVDGTMSSYIGFDGNTQINWGTFNFGQNVSLPTIPREAYVTTDPSFTVGNQLTFSINNAGNLYIKIFLGINGTIIKTVFAGICTSYSTYLTGGDNASIYNLVPNSTITSMFIRINTYSDAGYTNQVGGNRDFGGNVSVNTSINMPTFTTYTVANVNKSVVVQDKYSNTLITSSTSTLLGSDTRMIAGFSKLRATIIVANRAIALNYATIIKYRFVDDIQQSEASWNNSSDITIDIDNATNIITNVTAYDSRNLTTIASISMFNIANFVPILIYGLNTVRDNSIDQLTKLVFSGNLWKLYFGGGTNGVLNTCIIQYRWKYTTDTWVAQTWNTLTPIIDGSGNITFNNYINGDLGASGFDSNKSFTIEVRGYDQLSQIIVETTLSKGVPLIDYTKKAIGFNRKVDLTDTSLMQINGSVSLDVQSTTPSNPVSSAKIYIKGSLYIICYNDSGTIRYKYLDLSGTGISWVHTTTAP